MTDPRFDQPDGDWRDYANCLGLDPDLFFPERGDSSAPAKEVCRHCHVKQTCLDFAITEDIRLGIFGGLSGRQRRAIRIGRMKAADARLYDCNCVVCGGAFVAESPRAVICSESCRRIRKTEQQHTYNARRAAS